MALLYGSRPLHEDVLKWTELINIENSVTVETEDNVCNYPKQQPG